MSIPSMVCNGHKENTIEKCATAVKNELFSYNKLNCEPKNNSEPSSKDSMTIGAIPFPDFDHMYASSVEETRETNSMNMNVARSYLNSCHLNIIEEQARIVESQNQEIIKLKKQNESLIARIERMNRRLNLNQYGRRTLSRRKKFSCRRSTSGESVEGYDDSTPNYINNKNSYTDDLPLIKLAPFGTQIDDEIGESAHNDSDSREMRRTSASDAATINNDDDEDNGADQKSNRENCKSNFRIRFRRNELALNDDRRKRNKMVRFVEAKRSSGGAVPAKPKRNCAQTVDEKLKMENAVLFLKSVSGEKSPTANAEENYIQKAESSTTESDDLTIPKQGKVKLPILTTSEPYFMAVREDICHLYDPVTYTPAALEVPSFRVIEKDSCDPSEVPKDYYEDVTIEAAKERHLRFEIGERKRKKWDVQRIRELRQNERLKEKLRRRKSRWNKLESPKQTKSETSEQVTMLFPDIKSIEKIIITDSVPVTALGTSIPKIPSWGSEFRTDWLNDGTADVSQFEDDHVVHPQPQLPHHRESRSRTT